MQLHDMQIQILAIGILILSAYFGGLAARKLNVGEVIGQIFGGMIVGPHFLEILKRFLEHFHIGNALDAFLVETLPLYTETFEHFHFFVFLFLGIIAFSLGEELHIDRLKKVGLKPAIICFIQAILTWVLLSFGFMFIFDFPVIESFIIGSIGIATAPALIFILMSKLKIEGTLRNILANIVVLDDIIEVVFFSIFLGAALVLQKGEEISVAALALHVFLEILYACIVGFLIFLALKLTIKKRLPKVTHTKAHESFLSSMLSEHPTPSVEIFLIMTGIIAVGISLAMGFHLPFLITAVVAGFLISNFHSHAIFDSLRIGNVMPIFNLFFFALIGANVRLESFSTETLVFVIGYVLLRSTGKLAGNHVGCVLTKQDSKITACLPKLMLPQAGMAAVETMLVVTLLKGESGLRIFNTIIPALVIFELGGAWLSEKTLLKWKTWTTGERDAIATSKTTVPAGPSLGSILGTNVINSLSTTKETVISEMVTYLLQRGFIDDISAITSPVMERESLASTAIGEGLALPHCRTGLVAKVTVICALIKNPVDWNSPDKKPVDIAFLILTPENQPEKHLEAIRTITRAMISQDLRKILGDSLENDLLETTLAVI